MAVSKEIVEFYTPKVEFQVAVNSDLGIANVKKGALYRVDTNGQLIATDDGADNQTENDCINIVVALVSGNRDDVKKIGKVSVAPIKNAVIRFRSTNSYDTGVAKGYKVYVKSGKLYKAVWDSGWKDQAGAEGKTVIPVGDVIESDTEGITVVFD